MDTAAGLVHFLHDPTRHAILSALRDGPRTVMQLAEAAGLEQSNVSHHLAGLRQRGLVVADRRGRFQMYRVADPEVAVLLTELETVADRLERATYLVRLELPIDAGFHGYG